MKLMSKFYDIKKKPKGIIHVQVGSNLEYKNIKLQQQVYDMRWCMLTCIELLEKGNSEKALKLLKKGVYEK